MTDPYEIARKWLNKAMNSELDPLESYAAADTAARIATAAALIDIAATLTGIWERLPEEAS